MQKGDILTLLNVLGDYFICHRKSEHALQKEDVW